MPKRHYAAIVCVESSEFFNALIRHKIVPQESIHWLPDETDQRDLEGEIVFGSGLPAYMVKDCETYTDIRFVLGTSDLEELKQKGYTPSHDINTWNSIDFNTYISSLEKETMIVKSI